LEPGSAGGLYLASDLLGYLARGAALDQVFDRFGWPFCVAGVALALPIAAVLARRLG